MAHRSETVLPAASQIDADGRAVALGSGRHRATGATADPLRRNWLFTLLLVAGWLGQAGLRAWFSRGQALPLDNPDETAYLVAARFLGGGPGADFSGNTLYQGGYPLLITPVYWFTSSPTAVYHAVLLINAAVSAAVMPLGYLVCRRLGLGRLAAYGVAMVAALTPAGFFYSGYAIADAIFPVITLAWLLAIHSWLVAIWPRARCAAAVGAAALSGYAYAVHSRGLVLLAGFVAVGVFIAWRRPAARRSVAAAALTLVVTVGAGWALDRYLASALYPEGTRSLSSQLVTRLESVYGAIHVAEMAGGQLWRLVLDSWGIAGIGLVAAMAAIGRRGVRTDLRVMASLAVGVTVLIACTTSAALPAAQTQTWASGRYLDGMVVTFFLVGAVVLLRVAARPILAFAACVAGFTVLAAVTVGVYAGMSLPTGFGKRFNFGEPAVLTQDWSHASVLVASATALALLLLWVVLALLARRVRVLAYVLGAAVAAVSLVAVAQITAYCSGVDNSWAQAMGASELAAIGGLKPGEQIAVAYGISGDLRIAQAFEVSSTQVQFYNLKRQQPPADATVVEAAWPTGLPAWASWPEAPADWRVVAANRFGGWVAWRRLGSETALPAASQIDVDPGAVAAEGPGSRLDRTIWAVPDIARRHWLFGLLLAAGLVLRVAAQVGYEPALLFIDSNKYIFGTQFSTIPWGSFDPIGYTLLVLGPLLMVANLAFVAVAQHVAGMAMAAALYALMLRRGVTRWLAALAMAPVLLDAYQLNAEQTIMPDVLFEALLVAGIVLLLWRPRPGLALVILAGLALGASAPVRQVGEALIVPALIYVVAAAPGWRTRLRHGAVLTFCFALPIVGYMSYSAVILHYGFELSNMGDAYLYGRMAHAADCATLEIPADQQPLCPSAAVSASLGVDGLVNAQTAPRVLYQPVDIQRGLLINTLPMQRQFAYSVLRQQPMRVAGDIAKDSVKIFALTRNTSEGDTAISRWQFQTSYPYFPPGITHYGWNSASRVFAQTGGGGPARINLPAATALRDYQLHGGYTPGPVFLLGLLAGIAGIFTFRRRDPGLALACLLITGSAVAVLLGADLYEFSWRYQLPALITLPIAGAFGATALARRIRARRLTEVTEVVPDEPVSELAVAGSEQVSS